LSLVPIGAWLRRNQFDDIDCGSRWRGFVEGVPRQWRHHWFGGICWMRRRAGFIEGTHIDLIGWLVRWWVEWAREFGWIGWLALHWRLTQEATVRMDWWRVSLGPTKAPRATKSKQQEHLWWICSLGHAESWTKPGVLVWHVFQNSFFCFSIFFLNKWSKGKNKCVRLGPPKWQTINQLWQMNKCVFVANSPRQHHPSQGWHSATNSLHHHADDGQCGPNLINDRSAPHIASKTAQTRTNNPCPWPTPHCLHSVTCTAAMHCSLCFNLQKWFLLSASRLPKTIFAIIAEEKRKEHACCIRPGLISMTLVGHCNISKWCNKIDAMFSLQQNVAMQHCNNVPHLQWTDLNRQTGRPNRILLTEQSSKHPFLCCSTKSISM